METENTGAAAPPAAGESKPTVNATPEAQAAPAEAKTTAVPLTVVTAMRDELKGLKQQNELLNSQIHVYRANQQNAPAPAATAPAPPDPLEAVKDLRDSDVVTVADVKKIVGNIGSNTPPAVDPALVGRLSKMEVQLTDPNYETTIRSYLPEMVNQNPGLIQMIQNSPNPLLAALTYARLNPRAQAPPAAASPPAGNNGAAPDPGTAPTPINPQLDVYGQIDQLIANSEKPGSPAQVSGHSGLAAADRFASMSDEEFDAHTRRVISGQT